MSTTTGYQSRSKAISDLILKRDTLNRTIDLMSGIPMFTYVLLSVTDSYITTSKSKNVTFYTQKSGLYVVYPTFFNIGSLRCHVVAQEFKNDFIEKIKKQNKDTFVQAIRYENIVKWERIDKNDLPLYTRWYHLTSEFRKEFFEGKDISKIFMYS